jgi:hypothetical protein
LSILRSALGFSLDDMALLVIASVEDSEHGGAVDSSHYQLCANLHVAECNWLVGVNPVMGAVAELCASCKLTRARPNDADIAALAAFAAAEKAKRRLVVVRAHTTRHSYAETSLGPPTSVALPARTNFLTATHVQM